MVIGQVVKMLIVTVQKEETAGTGVSAGKDLVEMFQAVPKEQAGNFGPGILSRQPFAAQQEL